MALIELKRWLEDDEIPFSKHTVYRWASQRRFPKLIRKISGKLFVDSNEWHEMAKPILPQIKNQKNLKVKKGNHYETSKLA